MEMIVRRQDQKLCASITCITGTYAEPEGRVIFDHRHNVEMRVLPARILISWLVCIPATLERAGSRDGWRLSIVIGNQASISSDTRVIISAYRTEKTSDDHPCI